MELKPKDKDIGSYNEFAKVVNKQGFSPPKIIQFRVIVQPPKEKTNITCPVGKTKADCMPNITIIDNEGIMTVKFPISIKTVNETLFPKVASDLNLFLSQTQKTNATIINWEIISFKPNEIKIKLNISNALYISIDQVSLKSLIDKIFQRDEDQIVLEFLNVTYFNMTEKFDFQIKNNFTIKARIPPQKLNTSNFVQKLTFTKQL